MYVSIQQSFVSSLWGSSGGVLGDELSENGEGPQTCDSFFQGADDERKAIMKY